MLITQFDLHAYERSKIEPIVSNKVKESSNELVNNLFKDSYALDFIDKAILGELKDNLFWGNCYKTYIGQEFTEIYYNFEDEDPTIKPCKLPTRLLREIVEAWLEEYEKFRNKKK